MPTGDGDRSGSSDRPVVGVLALQGAFAAHRDRLLSLGVEVRLVRTPGDMRPVDMRPVDALVLPGGESTTMSRLLTTSGLFDELKGALHAGLPVFGTCAGMILCATEVNDARPDQRGFDVIDITVRRNGYGRQLDSFEADLDVRGLRGPFHAVFIRAPVVERAGPGVEVLASFDGAPVLVREGACTVAAFHPELTDDARLHELFVASLASSV